MRLTRPELPAYGIGALALVAIACLAGTGHPIPNVLELAAVASIGGGLGVTPPTGTQTVTSSGQRAGP